MEPEPVSQEEGRVEGASGAKPSKQPKRRMEPERLRQDEGRMEGAGGAKPSQQPKQQPKGRMEPERLRQEEGGEGRAEGAVGASLSEQPERRMEPEPVSQEEGRAEGASGETPSQQPKRRMEPEPVSQEEGRVEGASGAKPSKQPKRRMEPERLRQDEGRMEGAGGAKPSQQPKRRRIEPKPVRQGEGRVGGAGGVKPSQQPQRRLEPQPLRQEGGGEGHAEGAVAAAPSEQPKRRMEPETVRQGEGCTDGAVGGTPSQQPKRRLGPETVRRGEGALWSSPNPPKRRLRRRLESEPIRHEESPGVHANPAAARHGRLMGSEPSCQDGATGPGVPGGARAAETGANDGHPFESRPVPQGADVRRETRAAGTGEQQRRGRKSKTQNRAGAGEARASQANGCDAQPAASPSHEEVEETKAPGEEAGLQDGDRMGAAHRQRGAAPEPEGSPPAREARGKEEGRDSFDDDADFLTNPFIRCLALRLGGNLFGKTAAQREELSAFCSPGAGVRVSVRISKDLRVECLRGGQLSWTDILPCCAVKVCVSECFCAIALAGGIVRVYDSNGSLRSPPLKLGHEVKHLSAHGRECIAVCNCNGVWKLRIGDFLDEIATWDERCANCPSGGLVEVEDTEIAPSGAVVLKMNNGIVYAWHGFFGCWAIVADGSIMLEKSVYAPLTNPSDREPPGVLAKLLEYSRRKMELPVGRGDPNIKDEACFHQSRAQVEQHIASATLLSGQSLSTAEGNHELFRWALIYLKLLLNGEGRGWHTASEPRRGIFPDHKV